MGIRASSRRVSQWRKVWEGTRTNEGHWDEGSPLPLGPTDQTNRRQTALSLQTAVIVRVAQSGELLFGPNPPDCVISQAGCWVSRRGCFTIGGAQPAPGHFACCERTQDRAVRGHRGGTQGGVV